MMTLSQVICDAVSQYFSADLTCETRLGESNHVDFSGSSASCGCIRVEVERRREDPVNNVIKAWRQAKESPVEPGFILVHVFSGFYASRRAKMENARFAGQMMSDWATSIGRSIKYAAILVRFTPPLGESDPVVGGVVAQEIRDDIQRQLEQQVPISPSLGASRGASS